MREGYYMKKTLLISCMLLATTGAFANDAFTPINLSSAATTTKTTTASTGEETLGNGNIQNAILHIIKIKTKQAINNRYFATTPAKIAAREVVSTPSDAFATALIIKFGICRFSRFVLNVSGLNSAAKTLFFENKEVNLSVSGVSASNLFKTNFSRSSQK